MTFVEPAPARWKPMTAVLVVVIAGYLGICLLNLLALAWEYSLMDELGPRPAGYDRASFESLIALEGTLGRVTEVALIASIAAFIAWSMTVRRAAAPFGATGAAAVRHWTLIAWPIGVGLSLVATFVINVSAPTHFADFAELREALLSVVRVSAIAIAFRVAVAILLLVGVLRVARRLHTLTERPEVPMHWTFPMDLPPAAQPAGGSSPPAGWSQPAGVDVRDQDGPRADVVQRVHDPVHLGAEDHGLHGDPALPVERRDGG